MGKYKCVPLSFGSLSHVSPLVSERCQEGGIAVIAENSLKIIRVEKLGDEFTQNQLHTRYTPCKLLIHPETNFLFVLEKDHNSFNIGKLEEIRQSVYSQTNDEQYLKAPWHELGSYPRAIENSFASCLRIVDPFTMQTLSTLEFENGETCFSFHIAQGIINH